MRNSRDIARETVYVAPDGNFGVIEREVCAMPHMYAYYICYLHDRRCAVIFDEDIYEYPREYKTKEDAIRDLESIKSYRFDEILKNTVYVS